MASCLDLHTSELRIMKTAHTTLEREHRDEKRLDGSIKDNDSRGTAGSFLSKNIRPDAELSFVSAYFTIYAYEKLKTELDGIKHLRFLFGEPSFLSNINPGLENKRDFVIEEDSLQIPVDSQLTQSSVARQCAEWIKDKVDVRSIQKPNFLHGKMYHIRQGDQKAMVGSSNFTVRGLGLGSTPNLELNMVITDSRDVQDLKDWFDELWERESIVKDVKADVLKYLEKLYDDNNPEFIYYKTLYHIFKQQIEDTNRRDIEQEKIGFAQSEIWNTLLDFQKDGVRAAISKIEKHGGCIIADSVGLGKTYEALAVIRYYELKNYRVLVLCPKKLSANWCVHVASQNSTLNTFKHDRFQYTVLHHTDVGRVKGTSGTVNDLSNFNWGAYDLVVIDESHNFRNKPRMTKGADGTYSANRNLKLLDDIIKAGANTKVLLLSATPVNTVLGDLSSQLGLIAKGDKTGFKESIDINDFSAVLAAAQNIFAGWAGAHGETRNVSVLLERLDGAFFKLLDELTIARSRKHIIRYYDPIKIGIFPKRLNPEAIYPIIDIKGELDSFDKINTLISNYKLSLYKPSSFTFAGSQTQKDIDDSNTVANFQQSKREEMLVAMMRVLFFKRLESSVHSFAKSLRRTATKMEDLLAKIDQFERRQDTAEAVRLDQLLYEQDEEDGLDEELAEWKEASEVGKALKFRLADLDLPAWKKAVKDDLKTISALVGKAEAVGPDRDGKLADLKKLIIQKVNNPMNEGNKKVLIFTAYSDTAQYLYDNIAPWSRDTLGLGAALVTGSEARIWTKRNEKSEFGEVLTSFSPKSKERGKQNIKRMVDVDILIGTDCISEGQNLQDADYVVNYDIHWNPVRLIQRFGRVDRLKSENAQIQMVNFWPTKDLDAYINLKDRVEARMALVDLTATGEDNMLATDKLEELIGQDMKFRDKQLKRMQKENIDMEEMTETVSFSDFNLENFRADLFEYIKGNLKELRDAPEGLYAVVPAPNGPNQHLIKENKLPFDARLKPGTIFCLRQKGDAEVSDKINPLQPYYMLYITEDHEVVLGFQRVKSILDIMQNLCVGQSNSFIELCAQFDTETNHGKDMSKYSAQIKAIVATIREHFMKNTAATVTTDRGGLITNKSSQPSLQLAQYDLVTWLILK